MSRFTKYLKQLLAHRKHSSNSPWAPLTNPEVGQSPSGPWMLCWSPPRGELGAVWFCALVLTSTTDTLELYHCLQCNGKAPVRPSHLYFGCLSSSELLALSSSLAGLMIFTCFLRSVLRQDSVSLCSVIALSPCQGNTAPSPTQPSPVDSAPCLGRFLEGLSASPNYLLKIKAQLSIFLNLSDASGNL